MTHLLSPAIATLHRAAALTSLDEVWEYLIATPLRLGSGSLSVSVGGRRCVPMSLLTVVTVSYR